MLKTAIPILAFLDAQETIDFYSDKLGFKLISQWDGYLIFSKDEIFVHLWETDDEEIPKSTGCYIKVTEVDALFSSYDAAGIIHPNGRLADTPWGMRQFSVLDNNGNIIHFGQDNQV
jgi:catechol 2,3-dioxygenase-like lactoylglutathione lyase family enzyme